MNLPSVKTLAAVTSYPKELRKLLEAEGQAELWAMLEADKPFGEKSEFPGFDSTRKWRRSCYNEPSSKELKMSMANELCETYGVEYIKAGKGSRSPSITYCNSGDTYTTTLLLVRGRFSVGCWGDLVERGRYD